MKVLVQHFPSFFEELKPGSYPQNLELRIPIFCQINACLKVFFFSMQKCNLLKISRTERVLHASSCAVDLHWCLD